MPGRSEPDKGLQTVILQEALLDGEVTVDVICEKFSFFAEGVLAGKATFRTFERYARYTLSYLAGKGLLEEVKIGESEPVYRPKENISTVLGREIDYDAVGPKRMEFTNDLRYDVMHKICPTMLPVFKCENCGARASSKREFSLICRNSSSGPLGFMLARYGPHSFIVVQDAGQCNSQFPDYKSLLRHLLGHSTDADGSPVYVVAVTAEASRSRNIYAQALYTPSLSLTYYISIINNMVIWEQFRTPMALLNLLSHCGVPLTHLQRMFGTHVGDIIAKAPPIDRVQKLIEKFR